MHIKEHAILSAYFAINSIYLTFPLNKFISKLISYLFMDLLSYTCDYSLNNYFDS